MQDRPFAFVCSPFRGDMEANAEKAREYSRQVYEAGYSPLAPHLLFPQFLREDVPAEREAGIGMGIALLAQCKMLVVCGEQITEGMMKEIQSAGELGVPACTLEALPGYSEREKALGRDPGELRAFVANPHLRDPMGHVDHYFRLPITREEFADALASISYNRPPGDDYYFHSVQCSAGSLSEYMPRPYSREAMDEVNYLAVKLDAMPSATREQFAACMNVGLFGGSVAEMLTLAVKLSDDGAAYRGPEDIPPEYRVFSQPDPPEQKRAVSPPTKGAKPSILAAARTRPPKQPRERPVGPAAPER